MTYKKCLYKLCFYKSYPVWLFKHHIFRPSTQTFVPHLLRPFFNSLQTLKQTQSLRAKQVCLHWNNNVFFLHPTKQFSRCTRDRLVPTCGLYYVLFFKGFSLMLKRTSTSVIIMAVMILMERERGRMTLVVPKSRSLVLRMRWETVAPYGAVWCGFTRVPMPYALSVMPVRLVGHTWGKKKKEKEGGEKRKEKQQLDMNACVSKQTNQRAVMFVGRWVAVGERSWPFSVSLGWPRVWVLRRGADAHRWAAVPLSAPLALSLSAFYSPVRFMPHSARFDSHEIRLKKKKKEKEKSSL